MSGRGFLWASGAVLAAAALLRLAALGLEGLWCDEAYTAQIIRMPLAEMVSSLASTDDAPPLFYLLEKLIQMIAGSSETALRLLPAVAGIAAVLLLLLRSRSEGRWSDFWAAAFLATGAYGIFYARQARSYGLLILLALVVILSARSLLLSGSKRSGAILAASGILLCLTHHVGAILVATSLLLWPLRRARDLSRARWLFWHLLPLAVWAAWWIVSSSQLDTHAQLNVWMGEFWKTRSLLLAPLLSLGAFVPGALPASQRAVALPSLVETSPLWPILSALLAVTCLLLALLPMRGRQAARDPSQARMAARGRWQARALDTAFLGIPLCALTLASLILTPIYVVGRTDVIAYPACALLIGRGLARLPRWAAVGTVILWAIISLASLAPTYGLGDPDRGKGADRRLAEFIADRGMTREDWLVHTFLTAPSVEYYLERSRAAHRTAWFPEEAGINPAGVFPTPPDSLQAYLGQAQRLRNRMEAAIPNDGAVWILGLMAPLASPDRQRAITGAWEVSAEQVGYPTNLLVYSLVGTNAIAPLLLYRQDWIGGERVMLRIPRNTWVPVDMLPPVLPEAPEGAQGEDRP